MKYLMIVCIDPAITVTGNDSDRTSTPGSRRWTAGASASRAGALDQREATTVRVRAGEVLVSDGPFAETKEFMVGYDMLDCKDLDEAIEVASKHPLARAARWNCGPLARETVRSPARQVIHRAFASFAALPVFAGRPFRNGLPVASGSKKGGTVPSG